jgi:hypothetical protein
MEPDYVRLDPEERRNKIMAMLAALFGFLSLCAGMIPACGTVVGIVGILFGIFGRKSENRKVAILGIILSVVGLTISIVYGILLIIKKSNPSLF